MCGIVGIFIFNNQIEKLSGIKKMTDSLSHRGPDGEGFWSNDFSIALGHRRLSIIDLSEDGAQPMVSFNQRYIISFNGEIYNYIELKEDLVKKGYVFKTKTDTEVLLNLYVEKGESMLNHLEGMFAFSIWDTEENALFCARDRYGEKPFYYYHSENEFVFASEIKSIFSCKSIASLNQSMFSNFLVNDLVVNPNEESLTFFDNIYKLEKSHFIKIDSKGKLLKKQFYSIKLEKNDLSFDDSKEKLLYLLDQSVKNRLRSDVPIGTSLSGGIDSSIITYLISNQLKNQKSQLKNITFSARFNEEKFSENEYIDTIVNHLNIENISTFPDETLIYDNLETIFYHQEEPFQSASILNQWSVMKLAKENNTTVLLDGQGADEMFGGYEWYYKIYLKELYQKSKKLYRIELLNAKKNNFTVNSINFSDWVRLNFKKIDSNAYKYKNSKNKKESFLNQINKNFLDKEKNPAPIIKSYKNDLNFTLLEDFNSNMLETLLRFSDRNSMAFSTEVRLPFLDYRLVDFVFSLPSEFKIKEGWKKFILRKTFENKIPDKIIWRKDKMGYAAPQNKWLQSNKNQDYLMGCLSDLKSKKIITESTSINEKNSWKILMTFQLLNFIDKFKQ